MEMEQIVKLGKASEAARENVTQEAGEGGSTRASDALLAGRVDQLNSMFLLAFHNQRLV